MKNRDASSKRSATGARPMVEPRRLLAAVSLLGASLGVSAAAPADPISGSEPGLQSADAAARLAETKTPHSPGSDSSYTWGLNSPSDRLASNQKKGSRNTKSMGWDVRSSQSNQYKSNQNKNEIHIKSNQNKGTLPAAR